MLSRGSVRTTQIAVFVLASLLLSVLVVGCRDTPEQAEAPPPDLADAPDPIEDEPKAAQAEENQDAAAAEDVQAVDETVGEDAESVKTVVTIRTGKGDMTAEIYDEEMPITAGNFLLLIDQGFYENLTFHRVVPDFVIQGGDPSGDGTGGPDWAIPLEKPGAIKHEVGVLSMARAQHPDSAGSQFFVCLSNNQSVRSLDSLGGGYAAFGRVTEGMDVAQSINVGDALKGIDIVSESQHADAARETSMNARIPTSR